MSELSEKIMIVLNDIITGKIVGQGGETYNILDRLKGNSSEIGFSYTYEVAIPVWQNSMDFFRITTSESDVSKVLTEKTDDIIRIVEFVNESQDEIINALERDNAEGLNGFRPTKVSGISFDFSGETPKYSFYVESNEEYHFHIYINDDMSFDAGYIS